MIPEKKILVSMPVQLHKQIISKQYEVFQKENKHVSVAALIRTALTKVYGSQKEEWKWVRIKRQKRV